MIRVRKDDMGKVMKFKPELLPVKQADFSTYGEKPVDDMAEAVEIKNPYIGIYCHSDGYPDGVGNVLKEKFNDYDTALNLILGGFCSVVWYDEVRRYAIRSGEDWEGISPLQGKKREDVYRHIDSAYCYLFTESKGWTVNDYEDDITTKDGKMIPAPKFKAY